MIRTALSQATASESWLARVIAQADEDVTPAGLNRFLGDHQEYGSLLWKMREDGEAFRRAALAELYDEAGLRMTPDPRGQAAFGPVKVLLKVCDRMGVAREIATMQNGLYTILERYRSQFSGAPCLAIVQTFSGGRPPLLIVDKASESQHTIHWDTHDGHLVDVPLWLFQAAVVLCILWKDSALYLSKVSVAQIIAPVDPVDEGMPAGLLHMFAKGLLALGDECPPEYVMGCPCNRILERLRQVPVTNDGRARQPTGVYYFPSLIAAAEAAGPPPPPALPPRNPKQTPRFGTAAPNSGPTPLHGPRHYEPWEIDRTPPPSGPRDRTPPTSGPLGPRNAGRSGPMSGPLGPNRTPEPPLFPPSYPHLQRPDDEDDEEGD